MTVREATPADVETRLARKTWRVRQADTNDIEALMPLALEHWNQCPWKHIPPDVERLRTIFVWSMTTVGVAAWVLELGGVVKGFLALTLERAIFSNQLIANEPWWYVAPDARGRGGLLLLSVGERWAREAGAIMQVSVHDEKTGLLLERLGYNKHEISYQKGM